MRAASPAIVRAVDGRDQTGRLLQGLFADVAGGEGPRSGPPLPAPGRLAVPGKPGRFPTGLTDWQLGAAMDRGAPWSPPMSASARTRARDRLAAFLDGPVARYKKDRDFPARMATSRPVGKPDLWRDFAAPMLARGAAALARGAAGAEAFPEGTGLARVRLSPGLHIRRTSLTATGARNGTPFPGDRGDGPGSAWKQGRTGRGFVDAAMREMYVTGKMHNRARMIVAPT
jgi:deoxyribodipyrimidine photo-lyase